jgi:hypothetical protein
MGFILQSVWIHEIGTNRREKEEREERKKKVRGNSTWTDEEWELERV